MKIKEIRAVPVDLTPRPTTVPRVPRQATDGFVSPMRRYGEYRRGGWEAHGTPGGAVGADIVMARKRGTERAKTGQGVWGTRAQAGQG